MGLDQEFISPKEAAERHPLIDPKHYYGALWDELDGDLDPSGATYAFASPHASTARNTSRRRRWSRPTSGRTARGTWSRRAERSTRSRSSTAAGLWAREVGQMAGVALPVQPMEHHYLITEPIPAIAERMGEGGAGRLPGGIDYEANIYFRQERHGMLLGTYEPKSTPWKRLRHAVRIRARASAARSRPHRRPAGDVVRTDSGVRRGGDQDIICGPFTSAPDGNPMIGPVPGVRKLLGGGRRDGRLLPGGGVGRSIAEWMIDGEPSIDVWAMDIARFGEFATPEWGTVKSAENYERRFVMTFPNETLPKGRRQKTTALYDRLVAKGAVMDQGFGLEHALWFADGPEDAHEDPSFRRSRAHEYVAQEVKAVAEAVGAIEIANYSKHEFTGPGARAFLDRVLAGRVPKRGRLTLTPMLTEQGKLYGDLTVACLGEDHFMVFGSGAMQEAHRRWFEQRLGTGVDYRNRSDDLHGIGISGPNARTLLARITRVDVSAEAFRFATFARCSSARAGHRLAASASRASLATKSMSRRSSRSRWRRAIEEAGADLGLRWYGARALMSLRLEESLGRLDARLSSRFHGSSGKRPRCLHPVGQGVRRQGRGRG